MARLRGGGDKAGSVLRFNCRHVGRDNAIGVPTHTTVARVGVEAAIVDLGDVRVLVVCLCRFSLCC